MPSSWKVDREWKWQTVMEVDVTRDKSHISSRRRKQLQYIWKFRGLKDRLGGFKLNFSKERLFSCIYIYHTFYERKILWIALTYFVVAMIPYYSLFQSSLNCKKFVNLVKDEVSLQNILRLLHIYYLSKNYIVLEKANVLTQ